MHQEALRIDNTETTTDDVPMESNTDMIRITDISEVLVGDLVHVNGVTETMECVIIAGYWSGDVNGDRFCDSRLAVVPSWDTNENWLKNTRFDYAERPKPMH